MVIQRWQSVWLLIALNLVGIFNFFPIASITEASAELAAENIVTKITTANNMALYIVSLLVVFLLLIDILSFKNTRLQKRMTIISILLIALIAVCAVLTVYGCQTAGAQIEWHGSILLLFGAIAFAILGYRGIRHDEKLLKAADRLR